MKCSICKQEGHTKRSCNQNGEKNKSLGNKELMEDTYTKELLIEQYLLHKTYVSRRIETTKKIGVKVRLPSIPEDISENIVKFILHNHPGEFQDKTSKWSKSIDKKGDLLSEKEKIQECKCFTSDAPPTFGSNENWDVIYFLDARKWLDNKFTLLRISLSNTSTEWKSIMMTKDETYAMKCEKGGSRSRPHITWKKLYPQIKQHCKVIFSGTFEDIFNQSEATTGQVYQQ